MNFATLFKSIHIKKSNIFVISTVIFRTYQQPNKKKEVQDWSLDEHFNNCTAVYANYHNRMKIRHFIVLKLRKINKKLYRRWTLWHNTPYRFFVIS